VAALRDQLDGIKRLLQNGGASANTYGQPEVEQLYQELESAGMDAATARRITDEASADWLNLTPAQRSSNSAALQDLAAENIRKKLRSAPDFAPVAQDSKRAVIFIGPPGAGKTTVLTKIAIRECLGRRLSMRIISVDPYRVAAHEKLRSFAKIMGVGFTAASTMREFIEAIDEFRTKDILLIDTPGYGSKDLEGLHELAAFFSQMSPKEIHLVLPVSMSREGLAWCVKQYEEFQPDYLLFTKLDETRSRGSSICAALDADKPLSFFTAGQSIPEDIEPANPDDLLATLFDRQRMAASPAA
jgi:flagellar biosynthesis protein FlhF